MGKFAFSKSAHEKMHGIGVKRRPQLRPVFCKTNSVAAIAKGVILNIITVENVIHLCWTCLFKKKQNKWILESFLISMFVLLFAKQQHLNRAAFKSYRKKLSNSSTWWWFWEPFMKNSYQIKRDSFLFNNQLAISSAFYCITFRLYCIIPSESCRTIFLLSSCGNSWEKWRKSSIHSNNTFGYFMKVDIQ